MATIEEIIAEMRGLDTPDLAPDLVSPSVPHSYLREGGYGDFKSRFTIGDMLNEFRAEIRPTGVDSGEVEVARQLRKSFLSQYPEGASNEKFAKFKEMQEPFVREDLMVPKKEEFAGEVWESTLYGRAASEGLLARAPGIGQVPEQIAFMRMGRLANRISMGEELPDKDMAYLRKNYYELILEPSERKMSPMAKVLDTVLDIPGFLAELFGSGGVATLTKAALAKGITRAVTRYAGRAIKRSAIFSIGPGGHRTLRGFYSNTMPGLKFENDADLEKWTATITDPGDGFIPAAYKALGATFIEGLSEQSGPLLRLGFGAPAKALRGIWKSLPAKNKGAAIKAIVMKESAKHVRRKSGKLKLIAGRTLENLDRIGWNGVLEEMGEERVGDYLRWITGVSEESPIPDSERLLVEFISFSMFGGAMTGTAALANAAMYKEKLAEAGVDLRKLGEDDAEGPGPLEGPEPPPGPGMLHPGAQEGYELPPAPGVPEGQELPPGPGAQEGYELPPGLGAQEGQELPPGSGERYGLPEGPGEA